MTEQELREQLALELERQATYAMISDEYNFNDTAVRAKTYYRAAQVVRGEFSERKAWYISDFRALRRPCTNTTWVVLNEVSLPWR